MSELGKEYVLDVAICDSHFSNLVESLIRYQTAMKGVEGAFNSAFTLRRTGKEGFKTQIPTGPRHLEDIARSGPPYMLPRSIDSVFINCLFNTRAHYFHTPFFRV